MRFGKKGGARNFGFGKGEVCFIENNVSSNIDSTRRDVETFISKMIFTIPSSETDSKVTSPPLSTILSPSVLSPQIQNVHARISEKLTQDNYILWQFLMVPFLEGQNLFRYVDGTTP